MAERDSAAKRRRDRRLRMHWRHEQLSSPSSQSWCWARDVQRSTEPEDCQGMGGGGERDVLRHGPDDSSSQCCSRRVLPIDARCGGGWRACSRWAAVTSRRGSAAGPGSAAHRGAERRRRHVPDPRCSYAAEGGPTVGAALVRSLSWSRAGYWSTQDLVAIPPYTQIPEDIADGGTVGGSVAGPCRKVRVCWPDRWQSSSAWSLWNQWSSRFFSQDRLIPWLPSKSLTIQFHVVALMKVFMVFPQNRVQQRVRSRPFTFQFRTVAGMTFLLRERIFQFRRIRQINGFLALFPGTKKVRRSRALISARVRRESSSWPPWA